MRRLSGRPNGPYKPEIEAEIARLSLNDAVTLTGAVPEEQVLAALRAADVLVLSSFGQGEAAPVAVMEAMATGCPVICSRIGGTADMIRDGEDSYLVAQEDVAAITARLAELATNPDQHARISAAARQSAVANFDYRARAAQLKDAISAALAR